MRSRACQFTVALAAGLLAACGNASAPATQAVVGEGDVPAAEVAEEAKTPGRLVQVAAETDQAIYALGEPVVVRRVYENVGERPFELHPSVGTQPAFREIVIATDRGARLYEARVREAPEVVVGPGERVELRVEVELAHAGTYTIEVPPEYRARECGRAVRLEVRVEDQSRPEALAAKAERLGARIAEEPSGWPTVWTEAQKDLEDMGKAAGPHLRRWLRTSESGHLRAIAAKLLGRVGEHEGVEELVAGLGDEDADVRKMCLETLGGFRRPETLDAILARLEDEDTWVRVEAIEAAAAFEDERIVPALRRRLGDDDETVRTWAALRLAEKDDATGIEQLVEALERSPAMEAFLVVPALERLTGVSFGEAGMPGIHSSFAKIEEETEKNEALAAKWLAWWEDVGRARFGK